MMKSSKSAQDAAFTRRTLRPLETSDSATGDIDAVRAMFSRTGMPWPAKVTLRSNVTQGSFRTSVQMNKALADAAGEQSVHIADLHSTMLGLYTTRADFRDAVHGIIEQRAEGMADSLFMTEMRANLMSMGMPWHSRTPLRTSVKQTSFRLTLDFAQEAHANVPRLSSIAEVHLIMSLLYLFDAPTKLRVNTLLATRLAALEG